MGQFIRLDDLASTPGPPGPQGEQGSQGPLVLPAPLARQVLRAQRVLRDQQALRGQQVLRAWLAKTAPMGPLIHQITTTRHKLICAHDEHPAHWNISGAGINPRDDVQDLMRGLVGQNGVPVSLHADGDRIIIDGSGISGLDPNDIALANNLVTLNKNLVVNGGTIAKFFFRLRMAQQLQELV